MFLPENRTRKIVLDDDQKILLSFDTQGAYLSYWLYDHPLVNLGIKNASRYTDNPAEYILEEVSISSYYTDRVSRRDFFRLQTDAMEIMDSVVDIVMNNLTTFEKQCRDFINSIEDQREKERLEELAKLEDFTTQPGVLTEDQARDLLDTVKSDLTEYGDRYTLSIKDFKGKVSKYNIDLSNTKPKRYNIMKQSHNRWDKIPQAIFIDDITNSKIINENMIKMA